MSGLLIPSKNHWEWKEWFYTLYEMNVSEPSKDLEEFLTR